ncbi:hypothetical protein BN1708_004219, partial [Verticillium longisporum]
MSKAGKGDGVDAGAVGSQHPVPENIPHLSSPVNGSGAPSGVGGANAAAQKHHGSIAAGVSAGSPVKESSFLNRETSADGADDGAAAGLPEPQGTPSPASKTEGIPIRR